MLFRSSQDAEWRRERRRRTFATEHEDFLVRRRELCDAILQTKRSVSTDSEDLQKERTSIGAAWPPNCASAPMTVCEAGSLLPLASLLLFCFVLMKKLPSLLAGAGVSWKERLMDGIEDWKLGGTKAGAERSTSRWWLESRKRRDCCWRA